MCPKFHHATGQFLGPYQNTEAMRTMHTVVARFIIGHQLEGNRLTDQTIKIMYGSKVGLHSIFNFLYGITTG